MRIRYLARAARPTSHHWIADVRHYRGILCKRRPRANISFHQFRVRSEVSVDVALLPTPCVFHARTARTVDRYDLPCNFRDISRASPSLIQRTFPIVDRLFNKH